MAANSRNLARLARYDGAKLGQGELTFACSRRTFAKLVYWLATAIFPCRYAAPVCQLCPSINFAAVWQNETKSGHDRRLAFGGHDPRGWQSQSPEPAALEGAVKQRLVLDKNLLKSLPAMTIDVTFETGNGRSSGHYTGVLLWSVLEKAGLVDKPGKNAKSEAHAVDNWPRRLCSGPSNWGIRSALRGEVSNSGLCWRRSTRLGGPTPTCGAWRRPRRPQRSRRSGD